MDAPTVRLENVTQTVVEFLRRLAIPVTVVAGGAAVYLWLSE